jgi:hypothetical protein
MYVFNLNPTAELFLTRILSAVSLTFHKLHKHLRPSLCVGFSYLILPPRITYLVDIILQLTMNSGQSLARGYLISQFGTDFHLRPDDFDRRRISGYIYENFALLTTFIDELNKLIQDANPRANGQFFCG